MIYLLNLKLGGALISQRDLSVNLINFLQRLRDYLNGTLIFKIPFFKEKHNRCRVSMYVWLDCLINIF